METEQRRRHRTAHACQERVRPRGAAPSLQFQIGSTRGFRVAGCFCLKQDLQEFPDVQDERGNGLSETTPENGTRDAGKK